MITDDQTPSSFFIENEMQNNLEDSIVVERKLHHF